MARSNVSKWRGDLICSGVGGHATGEDVGEEKLVDTVVWPSKPQTKRGEVGSG